MLGLLSEYIAIELAHDQIGLWLDQRGIKNPKQRRRIERMMFREAQKLYRKSMKPPQNCGCCIIDEGIEDGTDPEIPEDPAHQGKRDPEGG